MNLKDKVIAITGGGQGLGRAMAVQLASKGAKLALIDLNEDKLHETVGLCREVGGEAKLYVSNVTDETDVEQLFAAIPKDMGALDGLINNAGITRDGLLIKEKDGAIVKKMSLDDWNSVINVNLTGVFLCGREAALNMIALKKPGVIINISSISRAGNLGQTNYSAAKSGVAAMAVTWAKELARYQIRANAIAPGFIATEMTGQIRPEVLEKITKTIPLRRMGQPEEIAHTAQFIFENDYVSGRVFETDGGLRL